MFPFPSPGVGDTWGRGGFRGKLSLLVTQNLLEQLQHILPRFGRGSASAFIVSPTP